MKKCCLLLFVIFLLGCDDPISYPRHILSPDGRVRLDFTFDGTIPKYSVSVSSKVIIKDGALGLLFNGGESSREAFDVVGSEVTVGMDSFLLPGSKTVYKTQFSQARITTKSSSPEGGITTFVFRAYNEGAAFRYEVRLPGESDTLSLLDERTSFPFTEDVRCWYLQKANEDFEGPYSASSLSRISGDSVLHLPFTSQFASGLSVVVTEADLDGYSGMRLRKSGGVDSLSLKTDLKRSGYTPSVETTSELISPWRVIMVAHTPADLFSNNLVMHLNPPTGMKDMSWIQPGKALWTWYSHGTEMKDETLGFDGMNTKSVTRYIDYAADLNCSYFLLDAGWAKGQEHDSLARSYHHVLEPVDGLDIKKIVDHARSKDIKIMLWTNYVSVRDDVDSVFNQFNEWGVAGVKVDFFSDEDQSMVEFVNTLVRKAAAHRLVVDLHSVYKPTGASRTYPNLLTVESVMGAEYNKWSIVPVEHNLILPFTRNVAGPMDYTPAGFNCATERNFRSQFDNTMSLGTLTHHLAMYVVYYSPLQMISDSPQRIIHSPPERFLKDVPTCWDEVVGIDGEIGRYAFVAKRSGDVWYIGGLASDDAEVRIPVNFMEGEFTIDEYMDHPEDPSKCVVQKRFLSKSDTLVVKVSGGGGYVARLTPSNMLP